jgi:GT2 family glycosyltransferase
MLERQDGEAVIGPLVKNIDIPPIGNVPYVEGWAVAISRKAWDIIGPWDEGMQISSYEDVDYSHRARKAGFWLEQVELPFVHLDQKQRFHLVPDYWSSEHHNRARFIEKHAQAVTA